MATRSKRKRRDASTDNATPAVRPKAFHRHTYDPASDEDKRKWKGFAEIESEPAFFTDMLKKFGVKEVKVQEVVSLDDELLAYLPRPVYGLIFLFKWKEEDSDKMEQSCPDGVWFANQTVNNACASVAMLNIVNNIPGIELGDNLQQFKDFTASFSPALRGDAIANFNFIKQIHNSFARKMDMLNADLQMKNDATTRKKGKAAENDDDSTAGFHFIAFVPISGKVWKLDGLERQPEDLGPIASEDWVDQAKPVIEARMAEYEDGQIEFAILSLVKDPSSMLVARLAENLKILTAVSTRLDDINPAWKDFIIPVTDDEFHSSNGIEIGLDSEHQLNQDNIDRAMIPLETEERLRSNNTSDILALRQELITAQAGLRASFREEQLCLRSEAEQAASRRHDYGYMMENCSRTLKHKHILDPWLEEQKS